LPALLWAEKRHEADDRDAADHDPKPLLMPPDCSKHSKNLILRGWNVTTFARHGQTQKRLQFETLHPHRVVQPSAAAMKKTLSSLGAVLLSCLLLTGCTTTITNLTPSTAKRNPNGLYPFEVELDTRDNCIKKDTFQPFVQVGTQIYPMDQTLGLKNRWETLVPVPANREFVSYRYKFNYSVRSIPEPTPSSKLSRPFQLQILDK
jgi:hypothetical protein